MLMLMLVGLLLRGWRSLPYIGWLVAPVVSKHREVGAAGWNGLLLLHLIPRQLTAMQP
jgi:hypothetical protein